MPTPTLFVASAASRFDADGALTDLAIVQSLQDFTLAFERWMECVTPSFRMPEPVAVAPR